MDNKNAIAATIGIGAIGSILAYYGYNNLSTTTVDASLKETVPISENGVGTTTEQKEVSMNNIKKQVEEEIKNTVNKIETNTTTNKEIQPEKRNTSEWSKFWSGQYKINTSTKPETE